MNQKTIKYFSVFFAFLTLFFLMEAKSVCAKEWNGIVPLKTSRAEVEKMLGKPDGNGGYKINGQYAFVRYLSEDCQYPENCICRLNKETVIKINVFIHYKLKLKKLKLDLKNFDRKIDPELFVYETYSNYSEGVSYLVFRENKTVQSITYLPSEKDCKETLQTKPFVN